MLAPLASLLLVHTASAATMTDRIVRPMPDPAQVETLGIRLNSPQGVLWQGNIRVSPNQSASYSQNLSQASTEVCPPGTPYDRTERSSISFNVYVQNNGQYGTSYRFDASWARPMLSPDCGESGTRTVQLNQALRLEPGQTSVIEGDAGFRLEVTRPATR